MDHPFLLALHLGASLLLHSLVLHYWHLAIFDVFEPARLVNGCQNCFTRQSSHYGVYSILLSKDFTNPKRSGSSSLAKVACTGKSTSEAVKLCGCRAFANTPVTWSLSCLAAVIPLSAGVLRADHDNITGFRGR